jgi:hypothetical protein
MTTTVFVLIWRHCVGIGGCNEVGGGGSSLTPRLDKARFEEFVQGKQGLSTRSRSRGRALDRERASPAPGVAVPLPIIE